MKSQSDKLSIREYIAITILMVGAQNANTINVVQPGTKRSMDDPAADQEGSFLFH